MLTLHRRCGQSILLRIPGIPDPVKVTLMRVGHKSAKLRFDAPREIKIDREERVGDYDQR